jgi:carbamoyltransferase
MAEAAATSVGGAPLILGLSAFYHDSAACLLRGDEIVAAAQEERFTRRKHDAGFPARAVEYCLAEAGAEASQLAAVAFYEKPFLKFDRLLHTHLAVAPHGLRAFLKAMPSWLKEKLWLKAEIAKRLGFGGPILFPEHHESHAASAFFPSPFREAAILTVDGVGEWTTTSFGTGRDADIELTGEQTFPHSIGLLYSAFTQYCGFKVNSGEYKLMGLAPYGEPVFTKRILDELVDLKADGSFRLNLAHFDFAGGLSMIHRRFSELFGAPPRKPESALTGHYMDAARSIQDVTEEIMVRIARHLRATTGIPKLCLAGGVALNCVANGRILRERIFDELWTQPAAGDAGGALGAALLARHRWMGRPRTVAARGDGMSGARLGPSFSDDTIEHLLKERGETYERLREDELLGRTAKWLDEGRVVGWFQGRMEFGPRALGARSILGDPRNRAMQETMNLKIKFRESFRPFAPSVLEEHARDWFDLPSASPYMLLVAPVAASRRTAGVDTRARRGLEQLLEVRSGIPAVTHVDGSARIQTVGADAEPRFRALLETFHARTGCPVLVNTSFNVRGEPLVCTPDDAVRCFRRTNMDVLVLGSCVLEKRDTLPLDHDRSWLREFELD